MTTTALELIGIRKSFDGFVALSQAHFTLRWGEVHALLGENGAGKSSLMNVAAGLYAPDLDQCGAALELAAPRLYREPAALAEVESSLIIGSDHEGLSRTPAVRCPAQVHQPQDVAELLRCSQEAAACGRPAPWSVVLPLYPTSPVDPVGP